MSQTFPRKKYEISTFSIGHGITNYKRQVLQATVQKLYNTFREITKNRMSDLCNHPSNPTYFIDYTMLRTLSSTISSIAVVKHGISYIRKD